MRRTEHFPNALASCFRLYRHRTEHNHRCIGAWSKRRSLPKESDMSTDNLSGRRAREETGAKAAAIQARCWVKRTATRSGLPRRPGQAVPERGVAFATYPYKKKEARDTPMSPAPQPILQRLRRLVSVFCVDGLKPTTPYGLILFYPLRRRFLVRHLIDID